MSLPPARRMTSHAARGLCEEIGQLRDDIAEQGRLLRCIDLMVQAIYVELHASNQARQPQE
jgi:hypothetical protein